jgi:hypothetical protein
LSCIRGKSSPPKTPRFLPRFGTIRPRTEIRGGARSDFFAPARLLCAMRGLRPDAWKGTALQSLVKGVIWIVAFIGAYLAVRLLRGL